MLRRNPLPPPAISSISAVRSDGREDKGDARCGEKSRARLFGRARHLGDPALAAGDLSLRGRHLHRRSRPGRGIGAGAAKRPNCSALRRIFVDDLREEFVRDFVFPMFRANALYEGAYLLGTSIARPLIAKRQIEIARQVGADAVAHGATGKGNDQVRFELGYYALEPDIKVIAPWREWDLTSRTRLLDYADQHQIPIARDKRGEAPFSVDANLLHISAEGKVARRPVGRARGIRLSAAPSRPRQAPDTPQYVEIDFERGDPVAIDGEALSPAALLTRLNELGGKHGIGRLDLVENRFVGMKSRGVYETPGGTILLAAHRGIESLTPRPRRGASEGRADAALCRADLQRLLVLARAADAAGADRQEPGERRGPRAAEALQGRGRVSSAGNRRRASTARPTSPSRKTRSTTSATPRALSSSTRCACASRPAAIGNELPATTRLRPATVLVRSRGYAQRVLNPAMRVWSIQASNVLQGEDLATKSRAAVSSCPRDVP